MLSLTNNGSTLMSITFDAVAEQGNSLKHLDCPVQFNVSNINAGFILSAIGEPFDYCGWWAPERLEEVKNRVWDAIVNTDDNYLHQRLSGMFTLICVAQGMKAGVAWS